MGDRRRLAAIALAAALLGAAGACSVVEAPQDVLVVGDSLAVQVGGLLREDPGNDTWELVAENGRTAGELLPRALEAAERRPDQVVVLLGTNDVLQGLPTGDSVAALGRLVDAFPAARCVHLVTVSTLLPTYLPDRPADASARRLNDWMRETAGERGPAEVLDWDGVVRRAGGQAVIKADRVHPNSAGEVLLEAELAGAVDRCSRPWS